ncbi:MAG TPA: hypothetical protein VGH48_06565 [Caldimonas sp.]
MAAFAASAARATAPAAPASAPATAASAAASDDPLQAPECQQALAALRDEEVAAASAPAAARADWRDVHAVAPGLDAARRRAAHGCLASRTDPPPSSRFAQPPVVVPPVAVVRQPLPMSPPAPVAIPTRPPSPPPLTSITACDASGCWASDGTRLNRVGPTLWGPRGACSVFGAVVHCP